MKINEGYQGLFLTYRSACSLHDAEPEQLENIISNPHVAFRSGTIVPFPRELVGKKYRFYAVAYASDGRNSGFLVELPKNLSSLYESEDKPYIATSLSSDSKAGGTAKLDFKPLAMPIPLAGTLAYCLKGGSMACDNSIFKEKADV